MVPQCSEARKRIAADPLPWRSLSVADETRVRGLFLTLSFLPIAKFFVDLQGLIIAPFVLDFGALKPDVGFFGEEVFEISPERFFGDDGGDQLVVVLLGVDEIFEQIDLLVSFSTLLLLEAP